MQYIQYAQQLKMVFWVAFLPIWESGVVSFSQERMFSGLTPLVVPQEVDVFCAPVDPVALNIPDYFDIVKAPMDLVGACLNRKMCHQFVQTVFSVVAHASYPAALALCTTNRKKLTPKDTQIHR